MDGQNGCITSRLNDLSLFLQMPANVRLSRSLPLSLLRVYIRLLGALYFLCSSKERWHIVNALCKGLGLYRRSFRSYCLAAKTFDGICEHYAEKLFNAYKPLPQTAEFLGRHVSVTNRAWLQKTYDRGKGCLLITGHFGAVEFLPLALSVNGFRIAMIVRYKNQHLKEACEAIGRARDAILIDANEPGVLQAALSAIRNGRILITQCDEFKHWRQCRNEHTAVFGVPIARDRTLDLLHRRTGAPACLGLMRRARPGYQLLIDPIPDGGQDSSLGERSWQMLERYILKYPEQWYEWKALSTVVLPLACEEPPQLN